MSAMISFHIIFTSFLTLNNLSFFSVPPPMHKTFKILNQLISFYSSKPITSSSLDTYLTLQIITDCILDVGELQLTKGQIALVNKLTGKYNLRKNGQFINQNQNIYHTTFMSQMENGINQHQQSLQSININTIQHCIKAKAPTNESKTTNFLKFTITLIHQYNFPPSSNITNQIYKTLLQNIDNIIIINTNGISYNNIIYHDKNKQKYTKIIDFYHSHFIQKYLIVIAINQQNKFKKYQNQDLKLQYFYQELDQYCYICDIFHGHINLRICTYPQSKSPLSLQHNTKQKIKFLLLTALSYSNSYDDLDVLLRPQIPNDAYIRTITQRGNRIGFNDIKNSKQYQLIKKKQNSFYTFKVQQSEQKQSIADLFLIWVLVDGLPLLQLVPLFHQGKKKRGRGSRKNKFTQKRSVLGYSIIEMQDKICQKAKCKQPHKQINNENIQNISISQQLDQMQSNSSLFACQSQDQSSIIVQNNTAQKQQQSSNKDNNQIGIYIINIIDKSLTKQQMDSIISSQLKNMLQFCIKERKQLYDNIQIQKNIALITQISNILQINEKDLYQLLYLSKL